MTYHLVYVNKTDTLTPCAFHAASDNIKELQHLHQSIMHELQASDLEEYMPAVHSFSTEDTSWKSVIKLDPWFKQFNHVFTDSNKYIKYFKIISKGCNE